MICIEPPRTGRFCPMRLSCLPSLNTTVEPGPVLNRRLLWLNTSTAMSADDNDAVDQKYSSTHQAKLAVHERDRYTCIGCRESFEDISHLDVDHVIPRGQGGSNAIRNKASECRRCHEAKHGERDHAPTVRFTSTGDMIEQDFYWFRHLWKHQFPALTELAVDYRIEPVFNIADSAAYQAWHVPLGDLRRLDEVLADMDDLRYVPLGAAHYM